MAAGPDRVDDLGARAERALTALPSTRTSGALPWETLRTTIELAECAAEARLLSKTYTFGAPVESKPTAAVRIWPPLTVSLTSSSAVVCGWPAANTSTRWVPAGSAIGAEARSYAKPLSTVLPSTTTSANRPRTPWTSVTLALDEAEPEAPAGSRLAEALAGLRRAVVTTVASDGEEQGDRPGRTRNATDGSCSAR